MSQNQQGQTPKSRMQPVALIDYGAGNLRSVEKALAAVGAEVILTSSAEDIENARKVILPGVGAFGDGMAGLQQRGLVPTIHQVIQQGKPFLGICLGMQLLFESSEEASTVTGLQVLPGRVYRFSDPSLKSIQTGWNQIHPLKDTVFLRGVPSGSYTYFNHGFYCMPTLQSDWAASTDYGVNFASIVARENVFGVQFHPEKSQQLGLQILRNFVELVI